MEEKEGGLVEGLGNTYSLYSHKEKGLLPRGSTLDSKYAAVTFYNNSIRRVLKDSTA